MDTRNPGKFAGFLVISTMPVRFYTEYASMSSSTDLGLALSQV